MIKQKNNNVGKRTQLLIPDSQNTLWKLLGRLDQELVRLSTLKMFGAMATYT